MSALFDPNLGDPVSRLRFRLGDVNTDAPDLEDETYQAQLDIFDGNETKPLLPLIRAIRAKISRDPDRWTAGTYEEEYRNRLDGLSALQSEIEAQAAGGFRVLAPTVGETCRTEFG